MPKISAGLLMFRRKNNQIEVLLAHPGGPIYTKKDLGFWSIPKGEVEEGIEFFDEAKREFTEETGIIPPADIENYIDLGNITQKSGKIVYAWAFEKDDWNGALTSNNFSMQWPPSSGIIQEFPEIDRAEFFLSEEAAKKIIAEQWPLVERLIEKSSF